MVALCRDHHPEADAGAFTVEQLRAFKQTGRDQGDQITGRFNWMRTELLAVVGGNYYLETPCPVAFRGQPVVAFERDHEGHFLLNVSMLSTSPEPRLRIERNDWMTDGAGEVDIQCPPGGRLVRADYANGDRLQVAFRTFADASKLDRAFPPAPLPKLALPAGYTPPPSPPLSERLRPAVSYPLTTVEIEMAVAGTDIKFGARSTQVGGVQMTGNLSVRGHVGLAID